MLVELFEHPISKYLVSIDGKEIYNPKTGYKLNPTPLPNNGYLKIGTYICSSGSVHTLVYEAYHSKLVPQGMQINHIDGNKQNNHIDNLELVTPQENTRHAYGTGLAKGMPGESNSRSKISNKDLEKIVKMLLDGKCNSCIANEFGLHDRYVSLIRGRKRWVERLPDEVAFPKSNKWKCCK